MHRIKSEDACSRDLVPVNIIVKAGVHREINGVRKSIRCRVKIGRNLCYGTVGAEKHSVRVYDRNSAWCSRPLKKEKISMIIGKMHTIYSQPVSGNFSRIIFLAGEKSNKQTA